MPLNSQPTNPTHGVIDAFVDMHRLVNILAILVLLKKRGGEFLFVVFGDFWGFVAGLLFKSPDFVVSLTGNNRVVVVMGNDMGKVFEIKWGGMGAVSYFTVCVSSDKRKHSCSFCAN